MHAKRGFTLVEIMIVVMIIGIIIAIATPNWITVRSRGRLSAVVSNLREIDTAKQQCAMLNGAIEGDATTCIATTLAPNYIKQWPDNSPVPGVYDPQPIGSDPTFNGKTMAQWQADPSGL